MKFKVEKTFLIKSEEHIELDPKDFLHCATIEELQEEVEDRINGYTEFPKIEGFCYGELLGSRFWDEWFNYDGDKSFYLEWQRLKGLPQEL